MRLYTKLTEPQVRGALDAAKDAGQVAADVFFAVLREHTSRAYPRVFEVQLGATNGHSLPAGYVDQRGRKLAGRSVKSPGTWAATWHEHGWFMARVFALDHGARFGSGESGYDGADDFNVKTNYDFLLGPAPWDEDYEGLVNHDTVREQTGEDA